MLIYLGFHFAYTFSAEAARAIERRFFVGVPLDPLAAAWFLQSRTERHHVCTEVAQRAAACHFRKS